MLLAAVLCGLPSLLAQSSATGEGVLTGRVVSRDGRPLAGAHVHLVPLDQRSADSGQPTNAPRHGELLHLTTERLGRFAALHLLPGAYQLSVTDAADHVLQAATVSVTPNAPAFVTMCACPSGLGSARSDSVGGDYGEALLTLRTDALELAGFSHDAVVTAGTSPGDRADTPLATEQHVTGDPPPTSAAAVEDSASASVMNASSLDGLSAQQGFRSGPRGNAAGGPGSGSVFALGSVRTLQTATRNYSAADGGSALAAERFVSRSGGTGVHGEAFTTLRATAFDAANPYAIATHYHDGVISSAVVKPSDTDVQAGAHAGFAPFARWKSAGTWRERVFSFAALDARFRHAPIESSPATPSFYALTPTQRALLGTRGVSTAQTNAALNYLDGLSGEIARSELRLLSFGRVDLHAGAHDDVAFTFAGNHVRSPAGAAFDQIADAVVARGRGSVGDSSIDVHAYAAHWAHSFMRKAANTLHVQIVQDAEAELPRVPLSQEPAISAAGMAPEVEIAPEGFVYGTSAELDRSAYPDEHRIEVADVFRAVVRAHVISIGGDWSRVHDLIDSLRNENGTFLYDSDDVNGRAGGLVDWITDATYNVHAYPNGGCPSITATVHDFCFRTYTQSFGTAQTEFTTHQFAGFAEDAFAPRPDLRVTLGVRYEYTLLPLPHVPNAGLDASLRALLLPAPLAGVTNAYPEDRNNAGPRAAIVWSPHSGQWFTLHVGYGMFFGRLPGTTLRAALADNGLPSGISQVRITPATETLCPQVANQGFGYPCAYTGTPPTAVAQTGGAVLFAGSFRLPALQRMSVAVERAVGRYATVQLQYEGAIAVQLPTSVDLNIAPATTTARFMLQGGDAEPGLTGGRTFVVPLYTTRRLANVGPVTAITSQATGTYHAGSLTAALRAWHGVQARGRMTFSRAIDDNPASGFMPRVNGSFDPFAIGYDKGLSDTEQPLRFAGVLAAHPSLHRGARWLQAVVHGTGVEAIASASSGLPYSYAIFGGTRLTGGYTSINGAGGSTFLPTVGRNTLRLPARTNVNLRVEREGSLHGMRIAGFVEAFNLLNTRNLSRVETRAFLPASAAGGVTPLVFQDAATIAAEGSTTPAFGSPTSSTGNGVRERLVSLGLRFAF